MKVLIATDSYLPDLGGVQSVATLLGRGLVAAGDEPAVLAPWRPGLALLEEIEGVPVTRIRLGRPGLPPREAAGFTMRIRAAVRSVRALLERHRPEIVHVIFVNTGLAPPLLLLRRKTPFGLVATAQGQDVLGMPRKRYTGRILSRAVLRAADAVTACSADLLASVHEIANRPLPLARAVPNMVDLDEFRDPPVASPHPRPYLLDISTLLPKKGIDLLLRAYAPLAATGPDLVVLGEGPERERLSALARELGIADRVHLKGAVSRAEITAHLAHAELFVLASRVEPFGIVLAEAMAAGRPVVAFGAGGIPEVVEDGVQGVVVPEQDVPGLRTALAGLLGDPARRSRMGAAGLRRAAEVFSKEAVTARYREIYASVILRRGPSSPR